MMRWFVRNILRPKWVVFEEDDGKELGISICGVVVGFYKAETYYPEEILLLRKPEKREFGESLHPPGTP